MLERRPQLPTRKQTASLIGLLLSWVIPNASGQKPPLTLDDFFESVEIRSVRISPDGQYVRIGPPTISAMSFGFIETCAEARSPSSQTRDRTEDLSGHLTVAGSPSYQNGHCRRRCHLKTARQRRTTVPHRFMRCRWTIRWRLP